MLQRPIIARTLGRRRTQAKGSRASATQALEWNWVATSTATMKPSGFRTASRGIKMTITAVAIDCRIHAIDIA